MRVFGAPQLLETGTRLLKRKCGGITPEVQCLLSQHYMEVAMSILKVTDIGNSVGVILPDEVMDRLGVKRGDILYAIETENGIELTAHNPALAQQLEIAERVMREDHEALRKLAE